MFCPMCGGKNEDYSLVCTSCGAVLPQESNSMYAQEKGEGKAQEENFVYAEGNSPIYTNANTVNYASAYSLNGDSSKNRTSNGEKRKNRPSIGANVAVVFICLILYGVIISLSIGCTTYHYLSPEGLSKLFSGAVKEEISIAESMFSVDTVDSLSRKEREEFDEFQEKLVGQMLYYYITGTGKPFDEEMVQEFFVEHRDILEESAGTKITDRDIRALVEEIKAGMEQDYHSTMGSMSREERQAMEMFASLASIRMVIIPAIIILVLIGGIAAIYNKNFDCTIRATGITLLVTSLSMLFFSGVIGGLLTAALEAEVQEIFSMLVRDGVVTSIILVFISIVLLIVAHPIKQSILNKQVQ